MVQLKATSSTHSGINSSVVLTTPSLVAEARRKEESLLGSCSKRPLVRREHGDHQWRQLTLNLLNVRERIKEKQLWCPTFHPYPFIRQEEKSHIQIPSPLIRMAAIKKANNMRETDNKYWWDWRENWSIQSVWGFLKMLKTDLPCDSGILLLYMVLEKCPGDLPQGHLPPMLMAAQVTVAKTWDHPRHRWVNQKEHDLHIVESYLS